MSEHAEVGGARKPGEGPQNPEKPGKTSESVLFGDVRRANAHPWLLVLPVLLCAAACAAGDASDAGDASELVMPKSI